MRCVSPTCWKERTARLEQIRLNAQLIDTRTDTHVWAEEYDRDLDEMFAIQSEIAQIIADQLHEPKFGFEKRAIEGGQPMTSRPLISTHAPKIFLERLTEHTKAELLQAVDLLNQAVARDPSFFDAYCQLANAHDFLYNWVLSIIHPRVWPSQKRPFRQRRGFVPMRVKRISRVRKIFIGDTGIMTALLPNWKLRAGPCPMIRGYFS